MKIFGLAILLFLLPAAIIGQCPTNGQNPISAFPVCASTVFTQNIVPKCLGLTVPVPVCAGTVYSDKNPYYYKFTAFQATQLEFTIKPLNLSDDYDWQLFDITGKNPNNIYTDASMFVCCNWSGKTGITGTSIGATTLNGCEGNGTPLITKAPTLIQNHEYLLMISHWDDNGQSGYNLTFLNASGFVDTTSPGVKNITANCVANKILVKLNKKMKCNSIQADGSEFEITTNPTIASVTGFGCATSFDTDSIIVSLANPLPAGNYTAKIKNGIDANTILDNCNNSIPENIPFDFVVVGASQPTPMDSVKPLVCNATSLQLVFKAPIKCSSLASNGSDFSISGPSVIAISSASMSCINGLGTVITISFANPVAVTGNYTITLKTGTDGNTLLNQCDVETPANSVIGFNAYITPSASFSTQIIRETCKVDTLKYSHNGNNNVTKWQWTFDGKPNTSNLQNPQVIYDNFDTRQVKLVVSNAACSDSIVQNIPIADHLLIPKFVASRDTTCPNNPETFTDSSKGNITTWKWDFANGQTSSLKVPPSQIYPVLPVNKIYPTKLVVSTPFGCIDSITKNIFVRGTIPTEFDSIIPPACAAKEVKIFFKQAMICSSVATDGSEFSITGITPNSIIGASISCVDGVGTVVTLNLANTLQTGNYQLSLQVGSDGNTIINDCGIATLPKTLSFSAFGHISTKFVYDSVLGCKADTLRFHHLTNNSVNSWQWTFDGSPAMSSLQNPTVVYTDLSKRDVQLVVSNGVCFDTLKTSLPIVDHSIQAKFGSVDTTCGMSGTLFTDSSKGIIVNWYWNFGNGLTSNVKSPAPVNYPLSYVFTSSPVQLVVKNIVNCYDTTAIKNIVIKPSAPAKMSNIDPLLCSPDSIVVHFNAPMLCNTVAPDGSDFLVSGVSNPMVVSANIIDCVNGFGRRVVVKFALPIAVGGYYKINLQKGSDGNTILNDCGIQTTPDFLGFVAYNKVNASFSVNDKIDCKEDTLFLNHTIANDENKWTWTINGTDVGNVNYYVLPYTQSDVKRIRLIVSNPVCSDTLMQTVPLVFNKVKADFTMSNSVVCPTESIFFRDSSRGNITSWNWKFGNGQLSGNKEPLAQVYPVVNYPVNTGSNYTDYQVQLIVGNNTPCFDTVSKIIRVASNCLIQVPSAFTPNGDGLNDFLYPLNAYKASQLTFRVFNRLGRVVFETSSVGVKWEGKFRGEKQPAGTYVWILDYTDRDTGKKISMNGTTVLIR